MKFIENKLEALDAYFEPKKESEKWIIILGVAAVIAYLAYAYLLPYTEKMYKKSEISKKSIQKSIIDNKTYLNSISPGGDRDFYVKKFDREIVQKKGRIVQLNTKINFINRSLEKLSDLLFNEKSWSKFINSITEKAEKHDINIVYITNKYVDNNGSFGYVLETGVGCKGSYKNLVQFMNELEQSVLVTDIYRTRFAADNNTSDIVSDINISVWGINH